MSRLDPLIGIVGSAGAYGRWLRAFFAEKMQLAVIGRDPAEPDSTPAAELATRAEVLLFATPGRLTPGVIAEYRLLAAREAAGKLWLEINSVKSASIAALLQTRAEVVGLHPMTAPPKSPTLKGRIVVVCKARLSGWAAWLDALLAALECSVVEATVEHHDQVMARVQALSHATHLAHASVLGQRESGADTLAELLPFRSALFEMDAAIAARILSLNPAIYEDIQFENPYARGVLRKLATRFQRLAALVEDGSQTARTAFRGEFLRDGRAALGDATLAAGNRTFEQVAYLLADLTDARTMTVYLPEDRPGSLRMLLAVFERHGVNIASLHSARSPSGELHFRFGFDGAIAGSDLSRAAAEIDASGVGRVIAVGDRVARA